MSDGWRDILVGLFMTTMGCAFFFMTMAMWREALADLALAGICAYILAKKSSA